MYLACLVPLQVLVLTHELADMSGSDCFQHLCEIFSPVLPMVLYGRTAKLGTPIKKEEAVWYGWRDLRACMYTYYVTVHVSNRCSHFCIAMN